MLNSLKTRVFRPRYNHAQLAALKKCGESGEALVRSDYKLRRMNRVLFFRRFIIVLVLAVLALPGSFALADSVSLYNQSFLTQINANWITPGKAETIAVIDQGIDFNHPDLAANQWQGQVTDAYGGVEIVSGWDFINNAPASATHGPHGTQVAGIIKATAGPNSNLKFMQLDVCVENHGCDSGNIIAAMYFAVDHGADIINLSLTTTVYDSAYDRAVSYAYSRNVLVVAAAGNSQPAGLNLDTAPVSPVCNDNGANMVLGVSAVDAAGNPASWANYGSCVDLYAPAVNVYTTTDPAWSGGQYYTYASGTSFAAPQVSALAAEIKAKNAAMTSSQLIAAIVGGVALGGARVLNINQPPTFTQPRISAPRLSLFATNAIPPTQVLLPPPLPAVPPQSIAVFAKKAVIYFRHKIYRRRARNK